MILINRNENTLSLYALCIPRLVANSYLLLGLRLLSFSLHLSLLTDVAMDGTALRLGCTTGLAVGMADWIIAAARVAIGALLLPGRDASIELLQTLPAGRKVVVAIAKLVPSGLMIALVLALILARRGQSLAVGRDA